MHSADGTVIRVTVFLGSLVLAAVTAAFPAAAQYGGGNQIESVRISSTLDPNAILITDVDVVFIFDEARLANFPETKSGWYSQKFMMRRNAGDAIRVVTTSVPQGFDYQDIILPEGHRNALRVLAFAQHQAQDTSPLDLTDMIRPMLEVDDFGLILSERDQVEQ
ncbi:MAG: hypothetical protein WDZ76_11445 [Pseudohongiellaceae bacterium]